MTQHPDPLIDELLDEDPEARALAEYLHARDRLIVAMIRARKARGWTQQDLADATGMKQAAIARLEKANTDPRFETIAKVCSALGLGVTVGDDPVIPGRRTS